MGILKRLKTLDNEFSWSFSGFIIAIISIGYAIYVDEFKQEKPKIVFDILSNTTVLSVKENLNKLDVLYKGQNLKEKKENLILLTVKISNDGNKDIRETDYYTKTPFGFKIKNGKIAEKPIIIETSNKIFRENMSVSYDSLNNINFNKIPFNEKQYFVVKTLIISKKGVLPSIEPVGIITGINESFTVNETYVSNQKNELSFSESIVFGTPLVHIVRVIFYSIIIIGVASQLIYFFGSFFVYFQEKRRKSKIQKFRNKTKIKLSEKSNILFTIYIEEGIKKIKMISKLLVQEEKLKKFISFYENMENENFFFDDFLSGTPEKQKSTRFEEFKTPFLRNNEMVKNLLENKLIIKSGDDIIIDEEFKNELIEFNYFIEVQ
jgi:hypothetical protein